MGFMYIERKKSKVGNKDACINGTFVLASKYGQGIAATLCYELYHKLACVA